MVNQEIKGMFLKDYDVQHPKVNIPEGIPSELLKHLGLDGTVLDIAREYAPADKAEYYLNVLLVKETIEDNTYFEIGIWARKNNPEPLEPKELDQLLRDGYLEGFAEADTFLLFPLTELKTDKKQEFVDLFNM